MTDIEAITKRVAELRPWHMAIPLGQGLSTAEAGTLQSDETRIDIGVIDPNHLRTFLSNAYDSAEITGKSLLDVGCNSGGYCFLANELGYGYAEGFDPRSHWIEQANFVKEVRGIPDSAISFSQNTIESAGLESKNFDITIFKGVLYHLADPIHCLKLICEATNDLILINSGTQSNVPPNTFAVQMEDTDHLMSGVEGLCWYPGGPDVVQRVCAFYGFPHCRVVQWIKDMSHRDKRNVSRKGVTGRFEIICARTDAILERSTHGLQ